MKTRSIYFSLFVAIGTAVSLLWNSCTTTPVTGRHQLNLVSSSEETQLGLSSFDQLKTNTPVNHDPQVNEMVQRVGKRIANVAGKDLPNAQWEFVVFESKEANAFCLPGGKVGVYTGILPITKDDEGLATVLGHEIGHATAHHGSERMSEAKAIEGAGQLLGSAVSSKYQSAALLAYGGIAKVGVELPFSRKQESEADHIGLIYMARAGYDPKAAVAFWERFAEYNKQAGGGSDPFYAKFLRTHPVDSVRIADLKKLQPEAEAEYSKSHAK